MCTENRLAKACQGQAKHSSLFCLAISGAEKKSFIGLCKFANFFVTIIFHDFNEDRK
jgi:hypothetical protein